MREKVRAFMEQYHMVTAGERVLLGLSGGADSVCLFHLLRELQEPLGFSLLAVHVNHNLRGAEAGRDAAFAENLCRYAVVHGYSASPAEAATGCLRLPVSAVPDTPGVLSKAPE